MSVKLYREKSLDQLKNELAELYRERFDLRMQRSMGQLPQTHKIRLVRRNIAQVKTIITQKEREGKSS